MTDFQIRHGFRLFAALFVSEVWMPMATSGGPRALYAKARAVVVFDRVMDKATEELML